MAQAKKTKLCPSCRQLFKARRDAKTCSATCRKRFQRAQASFEQSLLVVLDKAYPEQTEVIQETRVGYAR